MNVKRLLAIKAKILEQPESLNMASGIVRQEDATSVFAAFDGAHEHFGPCGTTACIAGHAVLMFATNPEKIVGWLRIRPIASELLDIRWNSDNLFYLSNWPRELRAAYEQAAQAADWKRCAEIAGERIYRFIEGK